MYRNHLSLVALALLSIAGIPALRADDAASSTESRLRDALRATMIQLRDAQTQMATMQEAQAESDKEKADLSAKNDALTAQIKTITEQAAADKTASDKAIADLKQSNADVVTHMVDALSTQINALSQQSPKDKAALDKSIAEMKTENPDVAKALDQYETDIVLWTTGYNQYVDLANKTEAARKDLYAKSVMLQRLVDDRETKNLELYKTGLEILDRYKNFSFGDALSAKEPFVGLTRAKLQELVQDYKDKLTDQRVTIGQMPTADADSTVPSTNSGSPTKTATP